MSAAKIDYDIIQYMMGHTIDAYEDVQSLGIETLRNHYTRSMNFVLKKQKIAWKIPLPIKNRRCGVKTLASLWN
jgi:hypothetical protein